MVYTLSPLLLQDSQNLVTLGNRTYRTLRSLAEGDAEVPRLMTVTPLDNSIWKGSWYENTGDNIASWLKDRAGVSCSFRLHFLCEKRLQPAPGHEDGYTVEMPTVAFRQFVSKAAPLLSVTCSILKIAAAVAGPVMKAAGLQLPGGNGTNLSCVRDVQCGEATLGEIFEGTVVGDAMTKIENAGGCTGVSVCRM